jgi:2,4-dichlorophenol 6-monooxygenase
VRVTPWHEWVVSRFTDGGNDSVGVSIDEAEVRGWLRECIGADVPIRIKDIGSWSIHDAVATSYRRGPVLLVGDAAHRHPPVNGLGTNTSMQDAYNLAWKLALVASGRAGERLLDSYNDERRPVGLQVVRRSWRSAENSRRLGEAIGLTSEQTRDGGLANLAELWSAGEQGRSRRAALQAALRETGFQFNAQGVELGQRYESAAVVGDDHKQDIAEPARRDPELYYDPAAAPGAYLQHAWIEHDRRRVSTLDVPSHTQLTLLTGVAGDPWLQAVQELAGEGLPIVAAEIGYRLPYDDVYGDWQQLRQVDDAGCVLVRPDRYIAWRSPSASHDPVGVLRATLKQILQLPRDGGRGPAVQP